MQLRKILAPRRLLKVAFALVVIAPAFVVGYLLVILTDDGNDRITTVSEFIDYAAADPHYAPFLMTVYAVLLATAALAVAIFK